MIAALALLPDDAAGRARLARCLAGDPSTGRPAMSRADCEEIVGSEIDDAGRWCDGHLVIELVNGVRRKRCVGRAILEEREKTREREPLPKKTTGGGLSPLLIVGGLAVVGLVILAR